MAGKLGMNVNEVKDLGKMLQTDSEVLDTAAKQITTKLNGTFWKGADAERFKSDWEGQYRTALKQVADALDTFGKAAVKQADQQETVSN